MITKFYPITRLCKDDIIEAFEGEDTKFDIKKETKKISDKEMKWIARRLADDYCEQLYWESLRYLAKRVIEERKK
jgi:hypothetical protein